MKTKLVNDFVAKGKQGTLRQIHPKMVQLFHSFSCCFSSFSVPLPRQCLQTDPDDGPSPLPSQK